MTAFCAECRAYVETKAEDEGIGPYEYCGQKGVDSQWVLICKECEGTELFNEDPENPETDAKAREVTIEDYDEWRRDDF